MKAQARSDDNRDGHQEFLLHKYIYQFSILFVLSPGSLLVQLLSLSGKLIIASNTPKSPNP
ncbi:hypothetical protein ANO14919_010810 [Xylariales sp. No.14919]|nr:hypothetical protein ANO14919_010810 [Xylariales sp. No.14919]